MDFIIFTGLQLFALEVNGGFAHRNDDDTSSLRLDTLSLFFDDVIVLTEDEIQRTTNLTHYLQQLISAPYTSKGTSHGTS